MIRDDKDNKEYWLGWSSIVDAPITIGMTISDYREWYRKEYSSSLLNDLLNGRVISEYDAIRYNRAGENEKQLTKEELLDEYCRNKEEER